jgi:hypothetical protein
MSASDWFWVTMTVLLFLIGIALVGWFVQDPTAALEFVTKINSIWR